MVRRTPSGPPPAPVVQRLRVRYAKRGRLRFTSHRDFARAFERALRRADVPMAYSAGFSPHPRISYAGAAPTGVASEAEYLELALAAEVDPEQLRRALDEALPPGLDVEEVVPAGPGALAERLQASLWRVELRGVGTDALAAAVARFLARDEVVVERLTKDGRRSLDTRAAVVSAAVSADLSAGSPATVSADVSGDSSAGAAVPGVADSSPAAGGTGDASRDRAILVMVVRQVTPAVRPDDVLAALRLVAGLAPAAPPVAVRVAQGPLDDGGTVGDPLAADRSPARTES